MFLSYFKIFNKNIYEHTWENVLFSQIFGKSLKMLERYIYYLREKFPDYLSQLLCHITLFSFSGTNHFVRLFIEDSDPSTRMLAGSG
jgi:hypothetical protein